MVMAAAARARIHATIGLGVFLAMALAVTLVFKSFNGDFGNNVIVTAAISQVGDSLDTGDVVTYRDVIVGEVTSFRANGRGGAQLQLRVQSHFARSIPANVTAVAVPASLFGATEILLLPPAQLSSAALSTGQEVPADGSPAATGLQTALADAYNLITSVHPAELDAALTSLASAIQNQGAALGTLVDEAAGYLRALAPAIPKLDAVISRFASVADEIARESPSLLQSLANLLVPAKAIVDEQQAVTQLLNIAPATADAATGVLEQTGDNFVRIVTNEQPFLQALSADPGALAASVKGFGSLAAALSSTFHNGHPSINVIISAINSSGLVPLLLGQQSEIVQKLVDPTPYGPAQCPRYPGASGPSCPTGAGVLNDSAVIVTTGAGTGGNVSSIGEPHEVAAVRTLISSITGIAQGNIPAAMDLLVGPLLKNTTTVIAR